MNKLNPLWRNGLVPMFTIRTTRVYIREDEEWMDFSTWNCLTRGCFAVHTICADSLDKLRNVVDKEDGAVLPSKGASAIHL